MKYLLFCCNEEIKLNALSAEEIDSVMQETMAEIQALQSRGQYVMSERLESVKTATMVRVRGGRVATTDGPFAETKEQIGGFWIIEADNLDAAVSIAAKFPSARLGGIEVRPIATYAP